MEPVPENGVIRFWDYARKAGVSAAGVLATVVAMGVLPDPWDKVAAAVLAIATYFGVYQTTNKNPETGAPVR